jgi:hypothetical protein
LACLLNAYPENGLELYRTLDYWQCKELIDIANDAKINAGDRLQQVENSLFNKFIDKFVDTKFDWNYLPEKLSLRQIKKKSYDQLSARP